MFQESIQHNQLIFYYYKVKQLFWKKKTEFIESETTIYGNPKGITVTSSFEVSDNLKIDKYNKQIECIAPTVLKVNGSDILRTTDNLLTVSKPCNFLVNGNTIFKTTDNLLTVSQPSIFNSTTNINGDLKHTGLKTILSYNTSLGTSTGLTITNLVNNRISQNFKANQNNTNINNSYDTQIVCSGNNNTNTKPNNSGSIFLNSQSVTLCSDNDVLPSKYVLFKVDGDTNISSQLFKSNTLKDYLSDASITINGSDGSIANKGTYNLTTGIINLNSESTNINSNNFSHKGIASFHAICNNPYPTYVLLRNQNLNSKLNTVGVFFKADPSKDTILTDASIIIEQNPLSDLFFQPALNSGTMNLNASIINLGNELSTVNVKGDLVLFNQAIINRRLNPIFRN